MLYFTMFISGIVPQYLLMSCPRDGVDARVDSPVLEATLQLGKMLLQSSKAPIIIVYVRIKKMKESCDLPCHHSHRPSSLWMTVLDDILRSKSHPVDFRDIFPSKRLVEGVRVMMCMPRPCPVLRSGSVGSCCLDQTPVSGGGGSQSVTIIPTG